MGWEVTSCTQAVAARQHMTSYTVSSSHCVCPSTDPPTPQVRHERLKGRVFATLVNTGEDFVATEVKPWGAFARCDLPFSGACAAFACRLQPHTLTSFAPSPHSNARSRRPRGVRGLQGGAAGARRLGDGCHLRAQGAQPSARKRCVLAAKPPSARSMHASVHAVARAIIASHLLLRHARAVPP